MKTITINPRRLFAVAAVMMFNLSSKEIQENVHVSKSVVSRHLLGVRESQEINLFLIEKVFCMRVTEFEIIDGWVGNKKEYSQ